jgi:glyoxylase-like metal-dependent hydrolase (beta-lactamase superfamily II)
MPAPAIAPFVLGEFATNCHLVTVPATTACWVVDCGSEPAALILAMEREGLRPEAIILTHAHCDHIAGLDQLRRRAPGVPVYAHEAERGFCSAPERNLSAFLGAPVSVAEPTHWLRGGEVLTLAGASFRVLHLPGHSPGGIALVHDGEARHAPQAIVGDTLFAGSMGRVDFPTSDPEAMRSTLRELMNLPDATVVYPGHGPSTSVGRERRGNPYVAEALAALRQA